MTVKVCVQSYYLNSCVSSFIRAFGRLAIWATCGERVSLPPCPGESPRTRGRKCPGWFQRQLALRRSRAETFAWTELGGRTVDFVSRYRHASERSPPPQQNGAHSRNAHLFLSTLSRFFYLLIQNGGQLGYKTNFRKGGLFRYHLFPNFNLDFFF